MPSANDLLSPAGWSARAIPRSPCRLACPPLESAAAQQRSRGDPHGQPIGVVGGKLVGDSDRLSPTLPGRPDIPRAIPSRRPHVPVEGIAQIAGGRVLGGDDRGLLAGEPAMRSLHRRGYPAMQLRAPPPSIGLVRHRLNQRMTERISRMRGGPDLFDEICLDQRRQIGGSSRVSSSSVSNRAPMTAAAFNVRFAVE